LTNLDLQPAHSHYWLAAHISLKVGEEPGQYEVIQFNPVGITRIFLSHKQWERFRKLLQKRLVHANGKSPLHERATKMIRLPIDEIKKTAPCRLGRVS